MRAVTLILVLLSIGSIAYSTDESVVPIKVGGQFTAENGTTWVILDPKSKITYLKGLSVGFGMGGAVILKNYGLSSDNDSKRAWMALDDYSPKGTYDRMVEYIDWIYETPSNRALTILDAYTSLAFIQNGDLDEKDLGEFFKSTIAGYKQ